MAKYVRYQHGGATSYGLLEGEDIQPLEGDFPSFRPSRLPRVPLADVTLLTPTAPSKILAIGSNFRDVDEGPNSVSTDEVKFWVKPPNVLNHPEGVIYLPTYLPGVKVYHEVELGVVIGKAAKRVRAADAQDYIFGYSIVNDVTGGNFDSIGIPEASPFFIYGKTLDGFGPYGPCIVTDIDPGDLRMQCRINGELRQDASSSGLRFNPAEIIEIVTKIVTLFPGDVISMGTPPGIGTLKDGDVIEAEIEHIGILRSHARNAPDRL